MAEIVIRLGDGEPLQVLTETLASISQSFFAAGVSATVTAADGEVIVHVGDPG